jgi:hypothetical protein
MIKEKIAEYLKMKYPALDGFGIDSILIMVGEFYDRIIYAIDGGGNVIGVSVRFMIDDDVLNKLITGEIDPSSEEWFNYLKDCHGENAHFFCLAVNDGKLIRDGMMKFLKDKKPKSISWFSKDMKKLNIMRLR